MICSCVVLPFLCSLKNGHSWHSWALTRTQRPATCLPWALTGPPFSAASLLECTLSPAGEVPLLWENTLKPFHKEGSYTTRNSRWVSVFTGLSRRENPVIRPVEFNEQLLRPSTCQLAAIFLEGPYLQGACRERGKKKKHTYIYIYMCIGFYSMKAHI